MPSQEPLTTIAGHQRQFNPRVAPGRRQKGGFAMPSDTLTITDNRTATKYDLPIENGTIRAMDLRKIKTGPDDFGLMTYDPAFMNTRPAIGASPLLTANAASFATEATPSNAESSPVRRSSSEAFS
jgi:hypothetical protein